MLGGAWEFTKAVFTQWGAIAFGAVATVLWWAYHKWSKGVEMPTWLFVTALVGIGFFACFKAWQEQRVIATDARAKVDEISKPNLAIELHEFNAGTLPNGFTGITIIARVRNTGAPSVAENYKLKIIRPDGKVFHPEPYHFPGGVTVHTRIGTLRKFGEDDYLMEKTFAKPVDRNSQITGVLFFEVQAEPDEVFVVGSDMVLTCADIFGTVAAGNFRLGKEATKHRYLPGINAKFIQGDESDDQQGSQSPPATKDDLKPPQP